MTARVSRILLLLSIVAVAAIVFQPHPTVASGTVGEFHATLRDLGAPAALTPSRAEALLNAGMFVPATLLAMLAFDRLSWTAVVASAFLASLAIETIQGLFLDARTMPVDRRRHQYLRCAPRGAGRPGRTSSHPPALTSAAPVVAVSVGSARR